MKYVYLLESVNHPERRYTGVTCNLKQRLKDHNAGKSHHTAKYKPWKLIVGICFADHARAAQFEKYLKSGSGQAFANRHFW